MPKPLPLIAPNPPRLSDHVAALKRIEASGIYSNGGPEVRGFEAAITARLFGGRGACLAVANATLGLMIAIREATGFDARPGTLALMPALTFAATAQAAAWTGLTPLICDVDPDDWSAAAAEEERLLRHYGARIGVVIPYATFGNAIDIDRYRRYARDYGVGIVVDAAASLGTIADDGTAFGTDAPFAVVHSMHATKTFAVAEGGLIHCADAARIARLRAMTNFGFESGRSATLPGINAKLPEVIAVLARAKLDGLDATAAHRALLEATYRAQLGDLTLQHVAGRRRATQFMPVLLPGDIADRRDAVDAALAGAGIGSGRYFSPHLGQQPWFCRTALIEPTPVADDVAGRMLSLPITDAMSIDDVARITSALHRAIRAVQTRRPASVAAPRIAGLVVVGGGPAGTALLTAAAKNGRLADLARAGLVVVDRDDAIGGGRLGQFAITSDSTAQTFLTAVEGNPHPDIAALADHPAARAVAAHCGVPPGGPGGAIGVPLVEIGPFLRATGAALTGIVRDAGGSVLTGHVALRAERRGDGLWNVRLKRAADGLEIDQLARNVVIATGGHQPIDRLAAQQVGGAPLIDLANGRLLQSDEVLSVGGFARVADLVSTCRAPRIAVVGGSTSALTTIALLLKGNPPLPLGANAVTLLHRRPLRPFYPSAEAALAEGFTDFGPDDVCPVSGFVYRLGGFRLEARDLVLRMLGVDGRTPDPRVTLHRITGDEDAASRAVIRDADLVIAALGYRPHALPVHGEDGTPIALAATAGGAMVDPHCRVRAADGTAIPGLYGIGLAAGFVPWGSLGGEASFSGQANGLWLWQNDVGSMIIEQILGQKARAAA
ncbi:DegT/DnrJ/EryC1/StrS family aminotransferase [Sphingomonas bacterium]|uniref:DegT/DnrJ/EryC1/StrS family aminotransferase n=1 Tax=Sphingomonas bacterium TaxID=1895847 RepID=UPI0015751BF2|nr:DegT/DnrJ/EryC1/StrS family aminotransferase [Sphingomonas bacterium]